MDTFTRFLNDKDAPSLCDLYRTIANHPRGFARAPEEISLEYVEKMLEPVIGSGIGICAFDRAANRMVGFIVARKPGPKAFDHVLTDLTIGVDPSYQSKGIGRRLFFDFLEHVQGARPDVLRVELIVRETNNRAISFYESIGFKREGYLDKRIIAPDGTFEGDIPMGWLRG